MRSYDVAIIGGGIIGGACAFELARRGLRVGVFDRQQPGMEASWAAAGMLLSAPETHEGVGLVPLARASLALYPQFVHDVEAASGKQIDFARNGGLEIFFGEDAERRLEEHLQFQRELNLPCEALPMERAREMAPHLSAAARAAAFHPDEARVDNRALTEAVLLAAARSGVEVHAGEGVTALRVEGSRCVGVKTAKEEISVGTVVAAAGSFTSLLPELARYAPTKPIRGQMLALRSETVSLQHTLRGPRGYIVPRGDGRLICGSTSEDAGYEKRNTPEGLSRILAAAVELVPALEGATMVESWSGLRPDTPDHLPAIGPTDVQGLLMATGHYRNGILLTPITAQVIAELITMGAGSIDMRAYRPMRFKSTEKDGPI